MAIQHKQKLIESRGIKDLAELLIQYGIKCEIVSQDRWDYDDSEMLSLYFPGGELRYIKPEFSINDDSWISVGRKREVNKDFDER